MKFSLIKQLFLTFKKYLGKHLYFVILASFIAAMAESFGITLLLPIIEAADTSGANYNSSASRIINSVFEFFGIAGNFGMILLFISIVFIAKGLFKFFEKAYQGILESVLLRKLKTKLYDAYNTMDYRYYTQKNSGHFINVITGQISGTIGTFKGYLNFLMQMVMAVSYLFVALLIAWDFALMAIGVGVLLMILFKRLNKMVLGLSRDTSREMSNLNKFLIQNLHAFKYILSTNQSKHLRKGAIRSVNLLSGYMKKQKIAQGFTVSIKEPVTVVFMIGIIAIQVIYLGAEIGPLVVALMLFYRGLRATIGIQESWQRTMNVLGSLEAVELEFEKTKENTEKDGHVVLKSFSHSIELKNISFYYDNNKLPVIHGIDITIPANNTVAFVGESGAGKTTLIDILTLLLTPQKGKVIIDGIDGEDIQKKSWRKQIGYVSQETVVFDDTIANNITLWQGDYNTNDEIKQQVEHAGIKAYAHDFISELPDGYNTVVGDRGVRLSGGQRQRLFVARELFKSPRLLILDEATSALDTESEKYIQKGIDELKGAITVVIIAHRLSTIKNADIIYVMDRGKVIEKGSFSDLTSNVNGKFKRMVNVQNMNV